MVGMLQGAERWRARARVCVCVWYGWLGGECAIQSPREHIHRGEGEGEEGVDRCAAVTVQDIRVLLQKVFQ